MDRSAALLNDTARTIFTYTKQLEYLNTAYSELAEKLELNNVPVTNRTEAVIEVDAGVDNIGGDGPSLPDGLVEIQSVWQRWRSTTDSWTSIKKYDFLPPFLEGNNQTTSVIPAWAWEGQIIKFIASNTDLDIRIEFIQNPFITLVDANSQITLINAINPLAFRTAALCARFIGENPTRADQLDMQAELAWDRMLGTATKGRQSITTRRRPFQANYKRLRNNY